MTKIKAIFLTGLLFYYMGPGTTGAADSGPFWIIDRAIIQDAMEVGLMVKLHLRNKGTPGNDRVKILGRWRERGESGSAKELVLIHDDHPLSGEKAGILNLPLSRLGPLPGNGLFSLELVIKTGNRETDRQLVYLP